jgi:glucokinase
MAILDSAIGIDIGGTHTKLARVSATGEVLRLVRTRTTTHGDPTAFLNELSQGVRTLIAVGPVRGVGLSLNGMLADDLRSSVLSPNSPALQGYDFGSWMEAFGLPFCIEEDLNAPTVAEYTFGAYAGSERLMTASIGTGLGAGLMVRGQVVRLVGGTLGDTGHIILQPDGPTCPAGCHGCGEALISVPGIERLAAQAGRAGTNAYQVIAEARQGEPWAVEILETVGVWLGQWLASLAPILVPSHILICGGVAEAGEILLKTAVPRFLSLASPDYTHCQLDYSRFGGLAGVIGAAAPLFAPRS